MIFLEALCVYKVLSHIEDIQWFDVKNCIYFTSKTVLFIYSRMQSTSENIFKILSHE